MYIVTSHGVSGTRQALKRRRFLCEQPLRRGVSCLPLLRMRVKVNVPLQSAANIIAYVEWVTSCGMCERRNNKIFKNKYKEYLAYCDMIRYVSSFGTIGEIHFLGCAKPLSGGAKHLMSTTAIVVNNQFNPHSRLHTLTQQSRV